jgi:drug/metabolite transporter (DMT)-like permease
MAESLLVGAVNFLDKLGVYDVALPFLLVFVITFAILDKTKVFGTEKIKGEDEPKRNLNAMAAFVIAFLVVASTNLVAAISTAMANMVMLLVLSVSFLLLVGSFTNPEEMKKGIFLKENKWRYFFMIVVFIVIVFIFLDALKAENSDYCSGTCSWLEISWNFMDEHWDNSAIGAIILLAIIGLFIWFITKKEE